jgi:hypothetical protein
MALIVLWLAVTMGCDKEGAAENACGLDLAAKASAVEDAANDLASTVSTLQANALAACDAIATDLGGDVPEQGAMSDDDYVTAVCAVAQAQIQADIDGGVTITLAVEPARCTVNAQAQFDCEASCDVMGTCTPGSVEARCTPGELSVTCDGTCDVNAWCEATADVAINCEGRCEGVCEGTCSGTTDGAGNCAGTCTGDCRGSCEIMADGGIDCGAMARCRGGCTGTATAPECHVELMPAMCDIDADCRAGCEAQGSFHAECTPGRVTVSIEGTASANLETTLETNLPALLELTDGFGAFIGNAATFVTAATAVADEVAGIPACAAVVGTGFVTAIDAAVSASASVTITVTASASVTSTAGAGG